MNNFIKQVIEEKFASKAQQRFFYAKANEKGKPKKEKKKWNKWAKEFSDNTDYEKIPDKVEKEVDEVVDEKGNIAMGKKPTNFNKVGITQNKTTDEVVKTAHGQMGAIGKVSGRGAMNTMKYWAESDISGGLGYKNTVGKDADLKDAKKYFKNELGIDDDEAEERLASYGYDKNLEGDKVRLIENPKKYIEDYVESVLNKKTENNDLIKKDQYEDIDQELEPIIKKQISALKRTLKKNNIPLNHVFKLLKKEDE